MTEPFMTDPPNMDQSTAETAENQSHQVTAPLSDAQLISHARLGDAHAYGLLYERHAGAARRLAKNIVKHPADVDDVVAESFARVLSAMRNGNGPQEAFRPYLQTTVRRVSFDLVNGARRQIPTDEADLPDPGHPFVDPVITELDRSLIARAFSSLPERWSAVLWHTEIEDAKPADLAPVFGMSANSVAALRYRAREGLTQAYLQLHLSDRAATACQPTVGKLAGYVRGRLSRRHAREVEAHLRQCATCSVACADLAAINDSLRGVLAPVLLGAAATGYLGASLTAKSAAAWPAAIRAAVHRFGQLLVHRPVIPITAVAAAASVAVPAFTLVHPPPGQLGFKPVPGITATHRARSSSAIPGAQPNRLGTPTPSARSSVKPAPTKSGRPQPTKSPSRSARPQPTGSPTAKPTPTPSPTPSPIVSVKVSAKLNVTVAVSGVLNLGIATVVTINVSDPGNAATDALTATVTLPAGLTLTTIGSSSWSCTPGSGSATCTHPALAAGAAASFAVHVLVVSLTGCGNSVLATVTGGALSASGSSAQQVACQPLL
jgi:RNA polymerase sigma factor (sigma-70 family)